jgi:hypothetical protein
MVNKSCKLKLQHNDACQHLTGRLVGVASEYDGVIIKPFKVHGEISKITRVCLMGWLLEVSLNLTKANSFATDHVEGGCYDVIPKMTRLKSLTFTLLGQLFGIQLFGVKESICRIVQA